MATKQTKAAPSQAVAEYDWSQGGAPTGLENVTQQDLGVPFLVILQKGSPQIDDAHPDYAQKKIEGAKVGDIIDSVSNTVVWSRSSATAFQFIPCYYERLFVEWKPNQGGFVRNHKNANILTECKRDEKTGRDVHKNGNDIVTTAYFYGLAVIDGQMKQMVIGLSSTQLKKARQWLNMVMAIRLKDARGNPFNPPMYSHSYAITTVPESNEKGNWYGWLFRCMGPIKDKAMIEEAISTAKAAIGQSRAALPATTEPTHY